MAAPFDTTNLSALGLEGGIGISNGISGQEDFGTSGYLLTSGGSKTAAMSWTAGSAVVSAAAWALTGNSGTSSATNFIGTTDAAALNLATNNTTRMNIFSDGRFQFAEGTVNSNALFNFANTGSVTTLVGTTQQGLRVRAIGNSAATNAVETLSVIAVTHSASFTVNRLTPVLIQAAIGTTSTVNSFQGIRFNVASTVSAAASSAFLIGDSASPDTKYTMYFTSTNPSLLSGSLSVNAPFGVSGDATNLGLSVSSGNSVKIGSSATTNTSQQHTIQVSDDAGAFGAHVLCTTGTGTAPIIFATGATNKGFIVSGGSGFTDGANIRLYGSAASGIPNYIRFYQGLNEVGQVSSSGAWTFGSTSSTVTHGINGNATITNRLSIGGAALSSAYNFLVADGSSVLSSTTQVGIGTFLASTSGATTRTLGVHAAVTTQNASYTTGYRAQYYADSPSKGASSTITRDIGVLISVPNQGTNNAALSDNITFTGNYFIHSTSTNPSLLSGRLTAAGVTVSDNILASVANSYDIGSSGTRFASIFAQSANLSSTLTVSGASTLSGGLTASAGTFNGQLIGKGTATNDNASTGYIGEYVESVVSTAQNFPGATTVWGDMTSISLTAGDWDLSGILNITANGATVTNGTVKIAISVNSGTTTTDHVNGSNQIDVVGPSASIDRGACLSTYRLSLSATTTVYFKIIATYTVATPQYVCRLSARRVR